jgi:hypothetical protein
LVDGLAVHDVGIVFTPGEDGSDWEWRW